MRDIILQIASKGHLEIVRNNKFFKNALGINKNKYSIVEYIDGHFKYILKTDIKSELKMYLDLMLLKPDIKNIKRDNFHLDIFDSFPELGKILTIQLKEN